MSVFAGRKFCLTSLIDHHGVSLLITTNGGEVVKEEDHNPELIYVFDSFDFSDVGITEPSAFRPT